MGKNTRHTSSHKDAAHHAVHVYHSLAPQSGMANIIHQQMDFTASTATPMFCSDMPSYFAVPHPQKAQDINSCITNGCVTVRCTISCAKVVLGKWISVMRSWLVVLAVVQTSVRGTPSSRH